nr:immunoglobulin light chain junction region [Macaca mulatta]
CQQDFDWPTTF